MMTLEMLINELQEIHDQEGNLAVMNSRWEQIVDVDAVKHEDGPVVMISTSLINDDIRI